MLLLLFWSNDQEMKDDLTGWVVKVKNPKKVLYLGTVNAYLRADEFFKQAQHFARFVVAAGLAFGVNHLTISGDIKNSFAAGNQLEVGDDVLIVGEQVIYYAHGVGRIISRHAVGDFNLVSGLVSHALTLAQPRPPRVRPGRCARLVVAR